MKTKLCLLLLCVAIAIPAWSVENAAPMVEVQSPHFTILTNSSEKQGRHVADQLERMRSVFHTLFPNATVDPNSPIIVLALKDKKSFESLLPGDRQGKGQLTLAGYFMQSPEKNYILLRLDAEGEHPFDTVYHEYTHLQFRKAAEWMPLWMNEGEAEFFQNTTLENKEVLLGQPSVNDILYLRQQKLIPLQTLLTVDASSPYYHEENKGSIFYSESWALTHYLMVTDKIEHTQRVLDYLALMSQHVDSVTAAQKAFGDLTVLQHKLQDYVSHGDYKMFRVMADTRVDENTFTAKPLTGPQTNAVRADVLAYGDREEDAKTLATSVLHDDPSNTQAFETMGYLAFRGGNHQEAGDWYEKAVQGNSQSYIAHYYFAVINIDSYDPKTSAQVEASLRAAIKLNPQFAPSYEELAVFYVQRRRNEQEAHMLSVQAVQLDPANVSFRINAANVLASQGNYDAAVQVLEAAEKIATTPNSVASLREQAAQMQEFAKRKQENEQLQASAKSENAPVETTLAGANGVVRTQQADVTVDGSQVQQDTKTHKLLIGKVAVNNLTKHPDETPSGPTQIASGIIHGVQCSSPATLDLNLQGTKATLALYSGNYFRIEYSALNFTPEGEIHPCKDLEGMKAKIAYAASSDKTVAGQVVSIELSK
ncbi:tetratricopeptide repeat protein [Silvibacterium acidisoli]|uniref:tetratricopeptide repeat protein n=1 Tax=Acidobacteriaceae bacterium ZG23-2 TaxID=2883246 RepID=UPI00406CF96A